MLLNQFALCVVFFIDFCFPGKLQRSKNLISKSKNRAATNSSGRKFKAKPAACTLTRYFKTKEKSDHVDLSTTAKPKADEVENSSAGCDQTVPHMKKTATSLILFEEVKCCLCLFNGWF